MRSPGPTHLRVELPDTALTLPLQGSSDAPNLAEWLRTRGVSLNTRCGQHGKCHGCEIEWRGRTERACRMPVTAITESDAVIRVPARNLLRICERETTDFVLNVPVGRAPLFGTHGNGAIAAAIDIGTTTLDCMVVNLDDAVILSQAGGYNRQMEFGDNVLARIQHGGGSAAKTHQLQEALVARSLAPVLEEALRRANLSPDTLQGIAMTGNPTMLHLLLGLDPKSLGIAPFTPLFLESRRGTVGMLDWSGLQKDLPWQLLPGLASYVGADITAGLFASGMVYCDDTRILLDIGTNGEIVLQHGDSRFAAATAAGPAFEGGGLRCGSRASAHAIAHIDADSSGSGFVCETAGDVHPQQAEGICGTAYLDFLSTGRRVGWLSESGRFEGHWWEGLPKEHKADAEWGRAVRLVPGNDHTTIGEADVAQLLQAKAAIAAGLLTLLDQFQLAPQDVQRIYIAGTFGRNVRTAALLHSGLLPGFQPDQIEVIGNSALAGTYLTLLDATLLDEMETVRATTRIIELNQTETFEDHFVDQLYLP